MKETVIYSSKPSWLNNCLLASISAGADNGKIQDDLISCDIQSTRMRFLGASQVLILFEDHPFMMHAFEADLPYWDKYVDDLKPWLSIDCAIDRLRCLAFVSLLGTRSDEDIRKTIILHIDGEDHNICIDKIDSLHYPMADSICYSMDTFHSNLVLENGYTTCGSQSSLDGTIANIPVKTTHNVGLDTREKMKSISNYEEEAIAKPHLTVDPAHRKATYSAPTRLQDHNSLVIINALQQLGGQSTS
ncbi:hypothetical protein H0E87_026729 [Populus deltoides]|uniref:Uncharacterized protein n=1 Tax=Populus deltoides TaxID=3696 RepID=A0A8T2WYR1_POPDE|nr:hypothetical protein H0E87_026729 [Populus deltoides]